MPAWLRSLGGQASAFTDRIPWVTFPALRFLTKTLHRDMRVFEYGSGGSTFFFAERVRDLVSIEHDPTWAAKVEEALRVQCSNRPPVRLVEPESDADAAESDPADPDGYVSSDPSWRGWTFRRYAASIDGFAEAYFDLVFIDGRARPSCFKHSVAKVKPGGLLVVDNAERPHYRHIHASLEGPLWRKLDFAGPGPYNLYFWQTCAWQRLSASSGQP